MKKLPKIVREWLPIIAIALVLSFTIRTFVVQAVYVPSTSMVPTLQVDDRLFIEKISNPENFQYGDIVVFSPPIQGNKDLFIKRLVGKGGDTIEIKQGFLYRNGVKIEEPYLKEAMNYDFAPVHVPPDHYFFLGDNRNGSFDSHLWPTPFVEKKAVVGKGIFLYYPFSHMRIM
ncbi:signal peptidase I [Brevibacillus laterosporus]|uniref:Signal peptidase I n=1 Tax=Brevibacillus laterosporus LMG 15441 TaxID=1042163 RepID=A0A075R6G7_BRELA|nr:signal peptidase I [Brevibacillus laterosporus]AIG28232.1 signal peptidase I S [Brevibacillus laterosporus LMG 15441]RJL10221.1 signal peptidase I [Brevibacillus laterosporus]TPH18235.1 signal peptidase I [Brevibacillus laterosporus]HAS00629.1 signal peptidase I [Brevibacillus sp.]